MLAVTRLKLVLLKTRSVLKLVQNVIHSILVVKNSLKLADVLIVSTKNTALSKNNCEGTGKRNCGLPVFYCEKHMVYIDLLEKYLINA